MNIITNKHVSSQPISLFAIKLYFGTTVVKGLTMLRDLLPETGFYKQKSDRIDEDGNKIDGPKLFMTDHADEERNALSQVFKRK